jgi:demethylmenaquinone methyltransferase/2-methoxy-6-polyprenyl-1,4-benzoquinol methylase
MDDYYRTRAPYYDRVYHYPERKADISFLQDQLPGKFEKLNVWEVASGTGFWTQFIAKKAASVLATDVLREPLLELEKRSLPESVSVATVSAFDLHKIGRKFDGAFIGLWLSHVRLEEIHQFFDSLHKALNPGAKVILLDNTKSQCQRHPISRKDEQGNTYQERKLDDGSVHEVLKNFPDEAELAEYVRANGSKLEYLELEHFWLFEYVYTAH